MRQLTHGSLFAGIDGFDLGFERAGIKTVWQVEIDPFCRRVLEKRFPHADRFGDIREVDGHELRRVDIITGGFPCQDVSQCNTVNPVGIAGERSGLWAEYRRIISQLRPRFVVVENVSALLNRGINRVLGDQAASGYDAEWQSLPAAAFGAPHIRDRVWILAYPSECERFNGDRQRVCSYVFPDADNRSATERGEDWQILELVPGIRKRVTADWWISQSRMDRSANGIPDQLDRLRVLGNAVVPQIAEWIGRRIVEACE